jgi:hypothetical protein
MIKHPNKDIREAIKYAISKGWKQVETGKSSHAFCRLKCGKLHSEHQMSVWSTPKSTHQHALQIRRKVAQCLLEETSI